MLSALVSRSRAFLPPLVLMMISAALAWPAIALHLANTPAAFDQRTFHEGVIFGMAAELPWPHLDRYHAAMAPGYHLVMAGIARATGAGAWPLQWVSSLFGLGLVALAARVGARFTTPWRAAALAAPLAVSPHVVSGSAWLATDNAAWLLVAASLAALIAPLSPDGHRPWRAAIFGAMAASIRQVHVWLAAPLVVAAYQAPGDRPKNLRHAAAAIAIMAAPVAALVVLWGGLTPPDLQATHLRTLNLTVFPFVLACVGALGAWFLPLAPPGASGPMRHAWIAAAAGAATALAIPTNRAWMQGRWGGTLWMIAQRTPSVAGRSLVLALLAAVGAVVLVRLWHASRTGGHAGPAAVLISAIGALTVAQVLNVRTFERYFEPLVLLVLAWLTAMTGPPARGWRWTLAGALALLLAALTCASIYLRASAFARL